MAVYLNKNEFCQVTVDYLRNLAGQGQMKPNMAKMYATTKFPTSTICKSKKILMSYLGLIGFYRTFCSNVATVI